MLDVYIRGFCCLFITGNLWLTISASKQLIENVNKNQEIFEIYQNIYSNLTEFDNMNASDFPNRPKDFQIEYLSNKQVKLKWKIDQKSLKSIKGFGLQLICNYGICKTPQPDNYTLVPHNTKQTDFELVWNISYGSSDALLYSIPLKKMECNTVRKTVAMVIGNDSEDPSNWAFPYFIFSQENNILQVHFGNAPDLHQSDSYEICLQKEMNDLQCHGINELPVKFKNIVDGIYDIMIKPDPFMQNKTCMGKENITTCKTAKVRYISETEKCVTETIIYPVVGGILIGIFSLLILYMAVKINGLRFQNMEKKNILLLHTNDNEIHEKAIEYFIECLEKVKIIAHRPNLLLKDEELQCLLTVFDNVLLVDSFALDKRQEAWAKNKDYGQFLQEDNSKELTKYLFNIIHKCYSSMEESHFLRCRWSIVPKESEFKYYPSYSRTFIIPDDLKFLAETIHGTSVDLTACKFQKSMLKEKILEELKFTEEKPDWFFEKYGSLLCTEFEVEIPNHIPHNSLISSSDMISHVSSKLDKMNQKTDKDLDVNDISLSHIDVISV